MTSQNTSVQVAEKDMNNMHRIMMHFPRGIGSRLCRGRRDHIVPYSSLSADVADAGTLCITWLYQARTRTMYKWERGNLNLLVLLCVIYKCTSFGTGSALDALVLSVLTLSAVVKISRPYCTMI
jgi:hypothetical protein